MQESFKRISRVFLIMLLVFVLPLRVMAQEETADMNVNENSTEISSMTDENVKNDSKGSTYSEDENEKKKNNEALGKTMSSKENTTSESENKNLKEVDNKNSLDSENNKDSEEISKEETMDSKEDESLEENSEPEEVGNSTELTEDDSATEKDNRKDTVADENTSKDENKVEKEVPEEEKTSEEKTTEETSEEENPEEVTEENLEEKNSEEVKEETEKEESENRFDISIVSDTHVLPEGMIGENEDYEVAKNSDRKLFTESAGLLKAALKKIDEKGSKYIFVPGDLTKDGEYEAHKEFVNILSEWKNAKPGREVFVVPGNHDINNRHAFDFSSGKKEVAKTTDPNEYMELYKDFVYENENIIDKYKDSSQFKEYLDEVNKKYNRNLSYGQGYESYVVRIKNEKGEEINGLTLIGLDTTIYSAESTKNHTDVQETDGRVTLPLIKWLVKKAEEANSRNDVVTVMSHHAFIPHFDKQEKLLSPYIIREWDTKFEDSDERINGKTPAEILANLGVRFLFTGHLHAQDVAKYDDGKGNVFYDIQTGSLVTYPLPIRHLSIENNISKGQDYKIDMKTDLIDSFSYRDPATGEEVLVKDALEYASKNQLTPELVAGLVNYYLDSNNLSKIESKKMIFDLLKKNDIEIAEEGYGNKIIDIVGETVLKEAFEKDLKIAKIGVAVKPIENKEKYGEGNKISIDARILFSKAKLMIRGEKLEESIDAILNQVDTKVVTRENLYNWSKKLVAKMMDYPIYKSEDETVVKTLSDIANDSYKAYLKGDEDQPEYITATVEKYSNPENDLVRDLLEYASKDIKDVLMDAASKIEYKKEGLEGNGSETFKFINNLLEDEVNPKTGKFLKEKIAGMLGANLKNTLDNKTIGGAIQGMLAKKVYGEDTTKKKVEAKDLVDMVYGMEPVQNLLSKLANSFGAESITDLAVGTVDGMTNENNGKYKYYFHPDNTHLFELTVNTEAPGNINLTQDANLSLTKEISNEYKLKDTKILVNGEEKQIDNDNIEESIKSIEKNLNNNDEVSVVMTLTNEFGNVFELESTLIHI